MRAPTRPPVTTTDWLWILHPVLMATITYPLLGVVLQQARRTRRRRLGETRLPASGGSEHTVLGGRLAAAACRAWLCWPCCG